MRDKLFHQFFNSKRSFSLPKHARAFGPRQAVGVFLVGFLIVSAVACSAVTSPSPSPKPSATKTQLQPTPAGPVSGTILYQSNWSHGLAGWRGSGGWKVIQGLLQSNLSSDNFITAPYMPIVPNYALEVRFQIVSTPRDGGYFLVTADKTPGKDGYRVGIVGFLGPEPHSQFVNPSVQAYLDPLDAMDSSGVTSDYEPGSAWHTYRIEVQGPQVEFFIDGVRKSYATSSQTDFLSNGPILLRSDLAVVRVSNVRIKAL